MPPAILSHSRWSFSPGFSWGLCRWFLLAGVWLACCLCTDFSREFFTKKAPENFGPFLAVVFRRCCFHRRGEFTAGGPALGRLPRRSAFFHGERAEYRPHLPRKFPANFAARYFMRAVKGLFPGILTPPYSPPHGWKKFTGNSGGNRAAKIPAFAVFAKNHPEILAKNNSPVPPKGGRGERFCGY